MRHRLTSSLALLAVTVLATACSASVSVGTKTVAEKDVEQQAAEQLAKVVDNGVTPNIDCPGDLEAKVGAALVCDLTVPGDDTKLPVDITVTSVDGDTVNFDVKVRD